MPKSKKTYQIIKEWVQTKQLISKENANWETEKIILTDLDDSLTKEISELENKLELFEKKILVRPSKEQI